MQKDLLKEISLPKSTFNDIINRLPKQEKALTDEQEVICSCIYDYRVIKKHKIGYLSMSNVLLSDYGFSATPYEVYKLTKLMGLALKRKKRTETTNKSKDRLKPFKDLVKGNFKVKIPNKIYCSDVIQFEMLGGILYLSSVMDLCGRYIICYHISFYSNSKLGNETLRLLNEARPFKETSAVFHTDRGSIYLSHSFHNYALSLNIIQSMGPAHCPTANAMIENFHRILREEIWYDCQYESFEDLVKAINEFIYYYNYERLTTKEGITPYQMLCNAYRENKIDIIPIKKSIHSVNLEKQKKTFVYRNPKIHL